MPDSKSQLHDQLRNLQDKLTYYLLAISASAIALSIQQVSNRVLENSLIPLGIAIFLWGASFYSGILNLKYVSSSLIANVTVLELEDALRASQRDELRAAHAGVMEAFESNSNKGNSFAKWQFRLLVLGGVAYIIWQVLEMWLRTVKT
jgi:hypothetical protein